MKNKILIFSILFNIILVIAFLFYYTNISNKKEINSNINNKKIEINICKDIINWKNTSNSLSLIYNKYKDIENNEGAKYDYQIQQKIFIEKDCDFFKDKKEYDYNICNDIKDNNISKIEKLRIPKWDKLMILSYLTNEDKCGSNEECNFYFDFVKKIENKNIDFPSNITIARDVEFYTYYKLYPNKYKKNLDNLFLSECNKTLK